MSRSPLKNQHYLPQSQTPYILAPETEYDISYNQTESDSPDAPAPAPVTMVQKENLPKAKPVFTPQNNFSHLAHTISTAGLDVAKTQTTSGDILQPQKPSGDIWFDKKSRLTVLEDDSYSAQPKRKVTASPLTIKEELQQAYVSDNMYLTPYASSDPAPTLTAEEPVTLQPVTMAQLISEEKPAEKEISSIPETQLRIEWDPQSAALSGNNINWLRSISKTGKEQSIPWDRD